jgi:hypothetical protein
MHENDGLPEEPHLRDLIEDYRQGLLSLIVPLTLLKHHPNRYSVPDWVPVPSAAWVHQQVYLHPYPKALMLRNHAQERYSISWDESHGRRKLAKWLLQNPPDDRCVWGFFRI